MNETQSKIIEEIRTSGQSMEDLVLSLPEEYLTVNPDNGGWSVEEIVYHARNVVMLAYGLRIRRLVYESDPFFPDYDEDNPLLMELSRQQPVQEMARMLRVEHNQLADLLAQLPAAAWQRAGTHQTSGALSIEYLAQRIVDHAREHHDQIRQTVNELSKQRN